MGYKKSYDKSVYQMLALITQLGIHMLVPILLLSLLGVYLDEKFGTSYWMILLFIVGAAAGGNNVYRTAKRIYGTKKCEENAADKERQDEGDVKAD